MAYFKFLFGFGLFLATAVSAHAQHLDNAHVQLVFAKRYAQEFADEYNQLAKDKVAKDVYGYFLPKAQRGGAMNTIKDDLQVHAEGNRLLFSHGGKTTLVLEIDDIMAQTYKVNGARYVHDWNGQMQAQRKMIHDLATKPREKSSAEAMYNLMFPQAEAIIPLLIAAGIEACVDGGCELAAIVAQRAAVFAIAHAPEIEAAAVATGGATRGLVTRALPSAARAVGRFAKYAFDDIYTDPQLTLALRSAMKTAKSPAALIKAPFRALGWLVSKVVSGGVKAGASIGTLVGLNLVWETIKAGVADYTAVGIPWDRATRCWVAGVSKEVCKVQASAPNVIVPASIPHTDGGIPDDFWCPVGGTNELSTIVKRPDNSQVVKAYRFSSANKGRAEIISSMYYIVGSDGAIDTDSFRNYVYQDGKIVQGIKPHFYMSSLTDPGLVVHRPHFADAQKEIENVRQQIVNRDRIFERLADTSRQTTVLTGEDIVNQKSDSLKAASDPNANAKDREVTLAKEMNSSANKWTSVCDSMSKVSSDQVVTPPTAKPEDGSPAPAAAGK